ncbi:MAG: transglutaminase TgpA family protein [Candidatus Limnocylindria bacterium]
MRLRAALRALLPPVDLGRLRFRGGWSGLPIFAIMTLVYPLSLQQADWVALSDHFTNIALVGIVAGTLIGNSRLRPLGASALSVLAGSLMVVLLTVFAIEEGTFRERAVLLGIDVNTWLTQVVAGEAARGQTVFALFLGASVWAASYVGAFALARSRRVWEAIVIGGACLTVNVSLALTPLFLDLVVFSLCALVLMVRLHIVSLTEHWEARNIQPTGEMDWRVLRGGLTWTAVLVIMALVSPRVGAAEVVSTAFNTFEAPYQRVEAEWQRFFAGVTGPSRLQGVSFAESIRLGQSPNLGDATVMHVDALQGRFWRVIAYDFYTGQGWRSTEIDRTDDVNAEEYRLREPFEATFEIVESGSGNRMYAANEPIAATVPIQFLVGSDRSFSSGVRALESRHAAGTYTVLSVVSVADKGSLRRASTTIPESIRRTYLQIPSSLPQRVRDLAREVTAGQENAYDRAEAIESFLRTNYRYAPVVRPPPPGRDPVDFFLFDLREDFCEYFASSMVMMLREVGVPARLVEGFTSGTFDPNLGKYVVKQINAHAWVEAYFPGYGWIEFEPTPSETPFLRPELPFEPQEGADQEGEFDQSDRDLGDSRIAELEAMFAEASGATGGDVGGSATPLGDPTPAVGLVGVLLLAALAFVARFELRFRRKSPIEAAWGKTRLLAAYVGHPSRSSETTYEFADALAQVIPEAREPIRTIADAHVRERYAAAGAEDSLREAAEDAWWRVARELLVLVPQRVLGWVTRLLPR